MLRTVEKVDVGTVDGLLSDLRLKLDSHRGCMFESAYEFPGRYARWAWGFVNPPISIESNARSFKIIALNERGAALLPAFQEALSPSRVAGVKSLSLEVGGSKFYLQGTVHEVTGRFPEEERSKQHSIFSVVRAVIELFGTSPEQDPQLGLYGSLGYDLTMQFDPVKLKHKRDPGQRDLLLYLPDEILVHDHRAQRAWRILYDFEGVPGSASAACKPTAGLPRTGKAEPFKPYQGEMPESERRDHAPGEYADAVRRARAEFKVGNLFEVVLSQNFRNPCREPPSRLFGWLRKKNPSPYMFIINLGEDECLVGASPEMFVRVEHTPEDGMRVETCPISGTIRRGADALEDAARIREILDNPKEESELTMCTDVDRNDKSRICRPGSVQVIGRRQIEKYSKLIHTVDHVEGYLRGRL